MKTCPKCKEEYEDRYCFCPICGSKLADDNHCPQCNELMEDNYIFCPYCGYKIKNDVSEGTFFGTDSIKSDTNSNLGNESEKTIRISDIFYEMLAIGQNASVNNNFWIKFGLEGYPQYQSKLSILKDVNNVKKNFFLIEEIICMSAGIGIHKFIETCCPDGVNSDDCINGIINIALSEPSLEKMFQLNRPDVKQRFYSLISDYVMSFAFEFSNMNNANPQFTQIFVKHAQANGINFKEMYQGARYLTGYYLDYYRNRMKELEKLEIINDFK